MMIIIINDQEQIFSFYQSNVQVANIGERVLESTNSTARAEVNFQILIYL